jgi:chromosome segregation ATPase
MLRARIRGAGLSRLPADSNNPVKLKKDVLVLQNSTTALDPERELAATKKLLREYRSGERRMDADGEVVRSAKAAAAPSDCALAEELRQLRLAHAVALGEVETKGRVAALSRDMCAKLQQENRELKTMKLQRDGLAAAKEAAEHDAAHTRQQIIQSVGSTEERHQDIRELRTKLATLLSVRDKVEQQHAEKVADLRTSIGKIQERELQLRGHIQLLKADLKAAQDAAAYYKQSAGENAGSRVAARHRVRLRVGAAEQAGHRSSARS